MVVGEPVSVAAGCLGEHVQVLDASVRRLTGRVVGEHLVGPAVDRAGEAAELGNVDIGAVLEEHDQPAAGVGEVGGGVDLAQQFLGHDRGG